MKEALENHANNKPEHTSKVDRYYHKITRIAEYYIFFCFLIITTVPLLAEDYTWVDPFIRFIYFTGFPLLLLIIVISVVKDAVLDKLKSRFEDEEETGEVVKNTGRK